MSILNSITTGRIIEPMYGITYGEEGIGKTTLAAGLPQVVMSGPEAAKRFNVSRLPKPRTFTEYLDQVRALIKDPHNFRSLGVDSLDWLEALLFEEMKKKFRADAIEDCFGGYGKWVNGVSGVWRDLESLFSELREKREMHIMMLAHYKIKKFENPMTSLPYDRYMMKLSNEAHSGMWREAVDFVFFATYDVQSYSSDKNAKKGRGLNGEARVIYTEKRASHDAKNRLALPYKMSLDIDQILSKVNETDAEKLKTVQAEYQEMLKDITDEALLQKAKDQYELKKNSLDALILVKNKLASAIIKDHVEVT